MLSTSCHPLFERLNRHGSLGQNQQIGKSRSSFQHDSPEVRKPHTIGRIVAVSERELFAIGRPGEGPDLARSKVRQLLFGGGAAEREGPESGPRDRKLLDSPAPQNLTCETNTRELRPFFSEALCNRDGMWWRMPWIRLGGRERCRPSLRLRHSCSCLTAPRPHLCLSWVHKPFRLRTSSLIPTVFASGMSSPFHVDTCCDGEY